MEHISAPASPRSVEIFVGAGGLALGLSQAGFKHEVVVDRDNDACNTIRLNQSNDHPLVGGWQIRETDIDHLDLSDVQVEPDLLAGGVPCQPFSICGKHRGPFDSRNMWPSAVRVLKTLKPKAFVFENVDRVATEYKSYFQYLMAMLSLPECEIGTDEPMQDHEKRIDIEARSSTQQIKYRTSHVILKAQDFGTAQSRSRLFIVGLRSDLTTTWKPPTATHSSEALFLEQWATGRYWERHHLEMPEPSETVARRLRTLRSNSHAADLFQDETPKAAHRTIRESIGDLPEPRRNSPGWITNHEAPTRAARAYGTKHAGAGLDEIAKTIRAGTHGVGGGSNMFHDNGSYRHFTAREAARLQDFPDDFRFHGSWSASLKQIGNAVPCRLAKSVGQSIQAALN